MSFKFLFRIFAMLLFGSFAGGQLETNRGNVCKHYIDYSTRADCLYNPDLDSTTDVITKNHNYPQATYKVQTPDGYTLQIFRVVNESADAQAVYIQHGANTESTVWVDIGQRSLAFYLYNLGFDVWMGNIRGSYYSQTYNGPTIGFSKWDFNIDTMSQYDIPAQLNFVKSQIQNKTNTKIIYIGHSMGTTMSYQYSVIHKQEAENNVCGFINLAPITFFDHTTYIGLPILRPFWDQLQIFLQSNVFPVSPNRDLNQQFFKQLCFDNPFAAVSSQFCNLVLSLAYGFSTQLLIEDIPMVYSYIASGISSRALAQFLQRRRGHFTYFDYGPLENERIYGSPIPPSYDLKQINNSFLFLYGSQDSYSNKADIDQFLERVTDRGQFEVIEITDFNHIDFMYAKDIVSKLYEQMMPYIERRKSTFCK